MGAGLSAETLSTSDLSGEKLKKYQEKDILLSAFRGETERLGTYFSATDSSGQKKFDLNEITTDTTKESPLFLAASMGHTESVKLLMDNGANVNPVGTDGISPLFMAAKDGHTNTVEALLEGDDIATVGEIANYRSDKYKGARSAIEVVADKGDFETFKVLLGKGGKITLERLMKTPENLPKEEEEKFAASRVPMLKHRQEVAEVKKAAARENLMAYYKGHSVAGQSVKDQVIAFAAHSQEVKDVILTLETATKSHEKTAQTSPTAENKSHVDNTAQTTPSNSPRPIGVEALQNTSQDPQPTR